MATAGTLSAIRKLRFRCRTVNSSEPAEMRLSAVVCTANIADAAEGAWALIAPYGDHLSPDGSYVQKFSRGQAEKVVKTWNSITGTAARVFKNVMHGLGPRRSLPVWDGHPETDKGRWPKEKLLAEISDIRTGNDGLEGRIAWNAKTANTRPPGPLYPSPLWWHWPPAGEPPVVFPELLESIGLVPTPNISSVPAWTHNATLASQSEAENQNQNTANIMDKKKLIELLGLASDATDEQIETALKGAGATANALTTANTARADAEVKLATAEQKLTTANAQLGEASTKVAALTTERDGLRTANATLAEGILTVVEKRGIITPAERPDFKTRLTTANTAAGALTELETRKPKLNTEPVQINGNRVDLSTANARQSALESAVQKRMDADKCDYNTAFGRVKADPSFAPLFAAMQDPAKASAA